jgi:hypothetical protein
MDVIFQLFWIKGMFSVLNASLHSDVTVCDHWKSEVVILLVRTSS